ncbi:hypothetical protein SAMN05421890_1523 [Ensifer adhaerens]|nr:hypothetical protein SAMN05421890_1523 [Ensifer adhaerens]
MKRRVFLSFVLASAPVKSIAADRLKRALDELEKATRAAYGNIEFEAAVNETERTPVFIRVRRA